MPKIENMHFLFKKNPFGKQFYFKTICQGGGLAFCHCHRIPDFVHYRHYLDGYLVSFLCGEVPQLGRVDHPGNRYASACWQRDEEKPGFLTALFGQQLDLGWSQAQSVNQ